jgi:hypothetical protein
MVQLSKIFDYQLEVVHLSPPEQTEEPERGRAIQTYIKALKENNVTFHEIHGTDVVKGLNNFCKKSGSDILTIVHYKHGFLSNLFGKCNAEQAAINHAIPLMIIPSNMN